MNILHIISDQHQAEAVGYEGHKQAITPHLDKLASQGMRFNRSYTNNPICTPSRVTILSGRYCHNHGYYWLSGPTPPPELPDFLSHFKKHGYHTAALGKLHLPNDPHNWLRTRVDLEGEYCEDDNPANEYVQWATAQGLGDEIDFGAIPDIRGHQQSEARPSKLTYRQTVEGYTNQRAMEFIDACGDKPWAMQVSYFRPHQCYTPAREFWDMYDDDLELPFGWNDYDASGRPTMFSQYVDRTRESTGQYEPQTPEARYRRVWHGYLACISMVDHAVGELMAHLEAQGLADNTIVIYHADHGAYSGMFGLPEKAPGICSEQICRIPTIWRVPGVTKPGSVTDHFTEHVDVAPTFCALAGVETMNGCDGYDISRILAGEDEPVRAFAVTENVWSKSLRWDKWRFVHYQRKMHDGEDVGELYDLEADPYETKNLYHDPQHQTTVEHARRLILEWLIESTHATTTIVNLPAPSVVHGNRKQQRPKHIRELHRSDMRYI